MNWYSIVFHHIESVLIRKKYVGLPQMAFLRLKWRFQMSGNQILQLFPFIVKTEKRCALHIGSLWLTSSFYFFLNEEIHETNNNNSVRHRKNNK